MTDMLIPLRLNELLGFVRLSHSAFPEPSTLILSFKVFNAVWRFNSHYQQCAIFVRGSEHSSSISIQEKSSASIKFKMADSKL
jgi:hypothetical protein